MKLSPSEWTVMRVVWDRTEVTARDVLDAVGAETGWAYTTVKTTLDRLVDKGALAVEKHERQGRYRPLLGRSEARRRALAGLVERAFGGSVGGLLRHLVAEERLADGERAALSRLLAQADAEERGPDGAGGPDTAAAPEEGG
ncbi:MAG: BlaI/MecI/CopY family transcriptional regulator [Planctomycetota bacterium]